MERGAEFLEECSQWGEGTVGVVWPRKDKRKLEFARMMGVGAVAQAPVVTSPCAPQRVPVVLRSTLLPLTRVYIGVWQEFQIHAPLSSSAFWTSPPLPILPPPPPLLPVLRPSVVPEMVQGSAQDLKGSWATLAWFRGHYGRQGAEDDVPATHGPSVASWSSIIARACDVSPDYVLGHEPPPKARLKTTVRREGPRFSLRPFDRWQIKGRIKKPDWVKTGALGTDGGAKMVRATSRAGRLGRGPSAHTSFLLR
ncbi:hypothetical protein CapIbe_014084 [Capra ibex]